MSQYVSKLHIKVCSPDVWKRFEHADDAGLNLAKLAKAGRTSYINDIGDECSYTEFELKELVNTIAGTLGKDGIIIACTTDINVDPYYQDVFYLGDMVRVSYDEGEKCYMQHDENNIANIPDWLKYFAPYISEKEKEQLSRLGIAVVDGNYKELSYDFELPPKIYLRETMFDGRPDNIENVSIGDDILYFKHSRSKHDAMRLEVMSVHGSLGYLPSDVSDMIAPPLLNGSLEFTGKVVELVKLSERNMPAVGPTIAVSIKAVTPELFNEGILESLKNIEITDKNRHYRTDGSAIFTKNGKTLLNFIRYSAETYSVPDGTKKIAKGAFKEMKKIKEILLPGSVVSVDDEIYKFLKNDTGLVILDNKLIKCNLDERIIKIPDGVTEISGEAFAGCSGVVEISIPDEVKKIGFKAFGECNSLEKIKLPDSVQEIEDVAFSGCVALKEINIPDGIEYIGECAFDGCSLLKEINLPDSIQEIGNWAFEDCSALEEITIPDSVQEIGEYAFKGCSSLKEINIPDIIQEIGESAFEGCSSLKEINIPDSVQEIGDYVFKGCSSLKEVNLPDSVQEIGSSAFEDCSALEEITIPVSVQEIGGYAFSGCSSLKAIRIPDNIKEIWAGTFSGCSSLEEINLPDSIQEVIGGSFKDCSALKEIRIPDGVKKIGDGIFNGCSSLKVINIPDSVQEIGESAFEGCSSLEKIKLPDSVWKIGSRAFYGCRPGLIELPDSVITVGDDAVPEIM